MSDTKIITPHRFREIPRLVGYRFSEDGSVWSSWTKIRLAGRSGGFTSEHGGLWNRLNPAPDKDGYLRLVLKDSSNRGLSNYYVSRLILEAFLGPCPPGMECRHMDNDKRNNSVRNLEWATHVVNISDKTRYHTSQIGSRHGMAKLTEEQIPVIRRGLIAGATARELGLIYGVNESTISRAANGQRWRHVSPTEG